MLAPSDVGMPMFPKTRGFIEYVLTGGAEITAGVGAAGVSFVISSSNLFEVFFHLVRYSFV